MKLQVTYGVLLLLSLNSKKKRKIRGRKESDSRYPKQR
jgi:hypothetical protein